MKTTTKNLKLGSKFLLALVNGPLPFTWFWRIVDMGPLAELDRNQKGEQSSSMANQGGLVLILVVWKATEVGIGPQHIISPSSDTKHVNSRQQRKTIFQLRDANRRRLLVRNSSKFQLALSSLYVFECGCLEALQGLHFLVKFTECLYLGHIGEFEWKTGTTKEASPHCFRTRTQP